MLPGFLYVRSSWKHCPGLSTWTVTFLSGLLGAPAHSDAGNHAVLATHPLHTCLVPGVSQQPRGMVGVSDQDL